MKLGVIGFGMRVRHIVNEIRKMEPACELIAINDIRNEEIKNELGADSVNIDFYDNPDEMLNSSPLDGVLIGTRCSLHARLAVKVITSGIPLFLEKPVATSYEDLRLLVNAGKTAKSEVVVSFPLRGAGVVRLAKEIIDSGKIGTVEHVQAVNNVPYGCIYYQNWYRNENETQGLFLQKATHDFDYIGYLIDKKPVTVCAMNSKQIFKGVKQAGLKCIECSEQDTCFESAVLKRKNDSCPEGEYCCFAKDTGNEDSGSALIKYETGMHVSYSQNFFARHGAQARGAKFLGYKGTLEFDFYTGILKVYMHHTPRVETYELNITGNHFGGDSELTKNFIDVVEKGKKSAYPLEAGTLSALLCLKARESALTETFLKVSWDWL